MYMVCNTFVLHYHCINSILIWLDMSLVRAACGPFVVRVRRRLRFIVLAFVARSDDMHLTRVNARPGSPERQSTALTPDTERSPEVGRGVR
jgi:hypothetical protein